jgi:cysteine-rich repeat protein
MHWIARVTVGVLALGGVACAIDESGAGNEAPTNDGPGPDSGVSDDGPATGVDEDSGPPGTTDPDDGPATMGPTTQPDPVCGDGILEGIEECDDGNDVDGDGCNVDCTLDLDTSLWQVTHGGDAMVAESGHGIAVDGAGNIVVGGYEVDVVGSPDMWLAKYDPAGNLLWELTLDPSGGLDDRIYGVAIDPADQILLVGDVDVMPSSSNIWVSKRDPQGAELWSTTFDGPDMGDDGGRGVASDSASNVVATGFVRVANNDIDIFVAKLGPGGAEQWSEIVAGPEILDDRGQGIAVDPNDDVVVAGFVSHGDFNRDVWLRKYDPDGAELWTETWDNGNQGEDAGFGLAVAPDGSIAVTGMTPIIATNQDVWLGRFDTDGALVWYKRFGGQAYVDDAGLAVAADADSNFIVAGYRGQSRTDSEIWLRKYDVRGNVLWSQVVTGRGADRDQATAVAADADANLVVTGEIRNAMSNDGDVWIGKFGPG